MIKRENNPLGKRVNINKIIVMDYFDSMWYTRLPYQTLLDQLHEIENKFKYQNGVHRVILIDLIQRNASNDIIIKNIIYFNPLSH